MAQGVIYILTNPSFGTKNQLEQKENNSFK